LLIVANALLFIVLGQYMWPFTTAYRTFPYPLCVLSGSCWGQIVNGMFAHADLIHIIGNLFFLYIVGDNVEITFGRLRYLIIYFASGVAAAFTQSLYALALSPGTLGVLMVGASGAISGLIGAYLLTYPGSAMCYCIGFRWVFKCFKVRATTYLGLWILFQFAYPLIASNVAIVAHLGGLVTGAVLALLLADEGRIREMRVRLWRGFMRGLPPDEDELRRYSLGSIGLAGLVTASAFLILVALIAVVNAPALDDGVAVVYGIRERVLVGYTTTWTYNPLTGQPSYTHYPVYAYRITEIRYVVAHDPEVAEKIIDREGVITLAVTRTDYLAEVTAAASVVTATASVYLIYSIVKKRHRRIEVTYISDEEIRIARERDDWTL